MGSNLVVKGVLSTLTSALSSVFTALSIALSAGGHFRAVFCGTTSGTATTDLARYGVYLRNSFASVERVDTWPGAEEPSPDTEQAYR
jgi:hypothetical protein